MTSQLMRQWPFDAYFCVRKQEVLVRTQERSSEARSVDLVDVVEFAVNEFKKTTQNNEARKNMRYNELQEFVSLDETAVELTIHKDPISKESDHKET